jgi:8-oxoguanine deaminase
MKTMLRLIEKIDELYTCDAADTVLQNAWIVVDGDKVGEIGCGAPPVGDFAERIDLSGSIAMPGLVNAHHHFFQTLTRALPRAQRGHLIEWLGLFYPVWGGMTPDDLAAAAASTSAELLLTGATTSADHFYLIPGADAAFVDSEIEAAKAAGMRLHLVRGSLTAIEGDLESWLSKTLGPRAGGLIDDPERVLADMRRTIDRYHDLSHGSMTTVALGPTTPTYDNLDYLKEVALLAVEAGVGLHMHLHPQPAERARTQARFGRTPMQVLDSVGYLTPRTWFAHGTRLDEYDLALMKENGVSLSHSPRMIMRLGSRITPLHDVLASGVRVAVGVDGAASNDGGSMLGEMRIALLLHRLAGGGDEVDPARWLDPYDILLMSTREAAAIIGRTDIGSLAPGMCADVTAFDMTGVDFAGARQHMLSGLLLAGDNTRASLTMVAGDVRVRHGKLLHQNEYELRAKVDLAAARLTERAARLTGVNYQEFPDRITREIVQTGATAT